MANDNKYVKYENKSVKITAKPAANENIAVYVRPGDLVDFRIPGVNLEDLEYELVGGDIVINIPNYGTFTFVSLALMGFNDSPPRFLSSSGKQFNLGDILSEVEQINNLPIDSLVSNAEINIPDNTARKNEDGDETENNPKSTPQVIIQEVEVDQAQSENIDETIAEFEIPPIENESVSETEFISMDDNQDSSSNSSVVEGATPTLSFDINIQHVSLDDQTSSNVLTVNGGGGVAYDNIYPDTNTTIDREAITKQTDAEVIDYSNVTSAQASSVVIYADNSSYFDIDKISRTITLNPEQPEGFAIETISISTSEVVDGFTVAYGTLVDGVWIVTKDNPDTTEIDGFTFDSAGNIEITITLDRSQTNSNFELTVSAESIFNIENIPEENRSLIETPVSTTLNYEKNYGVNVKEISDLSDPDEYLFESFSNSYGEEVSTGFVITTNINDNIINGSQTLENTIYGGLANDTITTGSADDTIYGSSGDDIITSGLGDDTVVGGEGNDTLDFSSIDLLTNIGINANLTTGIVTGDGTDKVSEIENITGTQDNDILIGDSNNNILKGEGGADTLIGYAGNDTIEGGDSSDTIEGGLGDDILKGDDGTDTVSYQNATSSTNNGVTVTLEVDENNPGVGSASGIDGNDVLYDFENVIGSNYNDTITGNNSTNIITALGGDDYIVSLMGNDTIYGGDGVDTLDFSNASAAEEIDLTINRARGAEGTDRIYDVENIIASNFKDTITGDSANNVLDGREDDDTLFGGAGDDTLLGGFDSDTLYGGAGDDIIDGEEGEDTASYADISTGGVTVSLAIQGTSQDTVNAGDDLLIDIENLIGTAFNDTLYGDSKANTIIGGSGDDTIATGGVSALGEDYIDGGSGSNDLVIFTDSPNAISLDLAITTSQDTGFGSLTVVNIENVEGSSYNDTLKGNSSSNTLLGFDGNDTLIGREGNVITIDYKKSFEFYKLAAKQNSTKAMYYIGYFYFEGLGVEKNLGEAKLWMKKAESLGHERAKNFIKSNNL